MRKPPPVVLNDRPVGVCYGRDRPASERQTCGAVTSASPDFVAAQPLAGPGDWPGVTITCAKEPHGAEGDHVGPVAKGDQVVGEHIRPAPPAPWTRAPGARPMEGAAGVVGSRLM
ncbi:hypothetical protein [Streptomyces sp. NPDC020362]|uniref:hypothetical protein n=1 Tax=unclassified Streptomyces TaxID=2593676 RepID=UPI00341166A7